MTRLLCKQVFFKIKPLSTTSHHATHSIGSMANPVIMERNLIGNTCKEDFDEKLMRVIVVRNLIDNTCKEDFDEKLHVMRVIVVRNLIDHTCKEDFNEKLMREIVVRNLIDNTCKEDFNEKLIRVYSCLFVFNLLCTAITPLHLRM